MDVNNAHWIVARKELLGKKVLEVGSQIVAGQEAIALRNFIQPLCEEYIGLDMAQYNGVDVVADAKNMPFESNSFDTVISLDALEHVDWPRDVVRECARVLKPGGHFFLATVFSFPIHEFPWDFWRFTPECLSMLIRDAGLEIWGDLTPSESCTKTQSHVLANPTVVRVIGVKPK